MNLEIISRIPESPLHPVPLLFVHGANAGGWVWDEYFLPYFAERGYAAHAVSLRGHGGSGGKDTLRWTSLGDYVEDVRAAVARIGHPAPVLIGHSMGGMVVQKYLQTTTAPAAVLMASVPPDGLLESSISLAWRDPSLFWEISLVQSLGPEAATFSTMRRALFSDSAPDQQLRSYFAHMQGESQRAIMDMMGLDLPRVDKVRSGIGRMPLLVCGAEHDAFFPVRLVHRTARAFGTKAVIFPGIAHAMMLEPTWRQVADRLHGWLLETLGQPKPAVAAEPAPVAEPEPIAEAVPEPEPVLVSEPEPVPEPEPVLVSEPVPEPVLVSEPVPPVSVPTPPEPEAPAPAPPLAKPSRKKGNRKRTDRKSRAPATEPTGT